MATTGTLTQNGKKSGGTVTVENMTGTASSCHETTYGYSVTVTDFSIDKITTSVFGTGDIGLSLTVKVGPVTCEYSGEGSFSYVGTNNGRWGPSDGRFGFHGLDNRPFHIRVDGWDVDPSEPIQLEPGELRFIRVTLKKRSRR